MQSYKYQLYRGSKKWVCPNCGRKTFVPYVLASDNSTLVAGDCGRCDREQKCGYFKTPAGNVRTEVPDPPRPATPIRFAPYVATVEPRGTLFDWAVSKVGEGPATTAWTRYRVGLDAHGRALFWQIDKAGSVHAGKAIGYDRTGHRLHEPGAYNWAHKMPDFAPYMTGEELQQCLFGEHLITPGAIVKVVESEKTAIMMSVLQPQFTWVACGGAQMLKNEARLAALDGCLVVLVPDQGQGAAWLRIAAAHGYACEFVCERQGKEGGDILDLYL